MASKVTLLEKKEGGWSDAEVSAIAGTMAEVQQLPKMPLRLVVMNKPLRGGTFAEIIGHGDFTEREVDYRDRWA